MAARKKGKSLPTAKKTGAKRRAPAKRRGSALEQRLIAAVHGPPEVPTAHVYGLLIARFRERGARQGSSTARPPLPVGG